MSNTEAVSVRILDREYTVGVGSGEVEGLLAAARVLDGRMREVRGANRWPRSTAGRSPALNLR